MWGIIGGNFSVFGGIGSELLMADGRFLLLGLPQVLAKPLSPTPGSQLQIPKSHSRKCGALYPHTQFPTLITPHIRAPKPLTLTPAPWPSLVQRKPMHSWPTEPVLLPRGPAACYCLDLCKVQLGFVKPSSYTQTSVGST